MPNTAKFQRFERQANILFGLNVWLWAIMVIVAGPQDATQDTAQVPNQFGAPDVDIVRLCIAALHATVGTLLLLRRPALLSGSTRDIIAAIPAVLLSGLAVWLAPHSSDWNGAARTLFVVGTSIAIAAFISLAGNFAVLPAVRGVSRGGLYRIVRHPAYAGETILVAACVLASQHWSSAIVLGITIVAVAVRIQTEENLLRQGSTGGAYAELQSRVRYRLFPGIW